jgi:Helix-turn-helix domain
LRGPKNFRAGRSAEPSAVTSEHRSRPNTIFLEGAAVIGKQIALIQLPNQALFSLKAAAQYLGIHADTLAELSDTGRIKCYQLAHRRTYKLEDLEEFRKSLPEWHNRARSIPASAINERKTKTHAQG